jgi:DNA helicase-2/ATP-dependent DNA helicase PcrA
MFSKLYGQLNPEQKKAVDATEGVVMVIAGPGTGKTQMLSLRIANILLTTQSEPENILALTYTEAGVTAMRQRLVSIIGPMAYRVGIYTFHGFANYCMLSHPEYFPETMGFEHISELEQLELLETMFAKLSLKHIKPLGEPTHYVKDALAAIGELKKEHVSPTAFLEILDKQEKILLSTPDLYHQKGAHKGKMKSAYKKEFEAIERNRELQVVYEYYQAHLLAHKVYDYEDMLGNVIAKFAQNPEFLLELQEQFHYILIDEHQDTNAAQNTIVALLASFHPQPNLFVVGDEKQAIYRFQGASLTNFLAIKQLYPETLAVSLNLNYRSNQSILDNSHALIAHNPIPAAVDLPARVALQAATKEAKEPGISIYPIDINAKESWFVAWSIKQLIDAGADPNEIAILTRKNKQLYPLQAPLQFFDVPFVVEGKRNLMDDPTVSTLLHMFKAVAQLDNDELITQVLFIAHFGVAPRDIIKISRYARSHKTTIWEVLDSLDSFPEALATKDEIKRVYSLVSAWSTLSYNQPLDTVFTTILKQSGLIEVIGQATTFHEALNNIIALYHEVRVRLAKKRDLTLAGFLDILETMQKHQVSLESVAQTVRESAVHLLTAHGAKGREFDYVFVLGVNDKAWGNSSNKKRLFRLPYALMGSTLQDLEQEDQNADERRLFYVALTRARKQVALTYAKTTIEGKTLTASQFLSEFLEQPSTFEREDTWQAFEAWFAKHKQNLLEPTRVTALSKRSNLDDLQGFIADTFRAQSLSVSALNNYLTCPWRYFFRNLVLLPEAKTGPLVFGSLMHQAISTFFTSTSADKIAHALENFSLSLEKQALTDEVRAALKAEGMQYLPEFLTNHASSITPPLFSELSIGSIGLSKQVSLNGKLDLVQVLNNKDEVRVWDFKTGKPKSRNDIEGKTKASNGDYKRQLVFYKLLLNHYRGGRFKMLEGVIDFIKPNPSGVHVSEVFRISHDEEQELIDTIHRVAAEITTLSFWEVTCDDAACEYCALRSLM